MSARYFLVKYEDLVESPINISRQLYNFAGAEFDSSVRKHVQRYIGGR